MVERGQAALEFLTTYGWAFLVILIAIGALSYFGILSPSKFLPQRCAIGPEFECMDYQIDSAANTIKLKIKNNLNTALAISSIAIGSEGSTALSCAANPPLTGQTYGAAYWSHLGLVAFSGANVNDANTGNIGFHTDSSAPGSYLLFDAGAGNTRAFNGLAIWTSGAINQGIYAVWNIQHSDDAVGWTNAYAGFGPFTAPPAIQPYTVNWGNAGAHRYWRLYKTNGATGGGYHNEVQFYDTNLQAWKPGNFAEFQWSGCNSQAAGFAKGEKGKVQISITYYPVTSGSSYSKQVKGELLATVI